MGVFVYVYSFFLLFFLFVYFFYHLLPTFLRSLISNISSQRFMIKRAYNFITDHKRSTNHTLSAVFKKTPFFKPLKENESRLS